MNEDVIQAGEHLRRKNCQPLGDDFSSKTVLRTTVREVDDQVELLILERLDGKEGVIDQNIGMMLIQLVFSSNIIKYWITLGRLSGLVEEV